MAVVSRILAALLGLVLVVAGVLVALEVAAAAFGQQPVALPYPDAATIGRNVPWGDPVTQGGLAVVTAIGLVLLVSQLIPRRDAYLPVSGDPAGTETVVHRSGFERSLARAATATDGVHDARVRAGRSGLRVRAVTRRRQTDGMEERVRNAVAGRLRDVPIAGSPGVAVEVRQEEAR